MENNYENLEELNSIQKVDPPAFLYTRIVQKIEITENNKYGQREVLSLVLSLFLVLVINIAILASKTKESNTEKNIVEELNLMPANSLYYE
jgi:hypothetical protein